MSHPLLWFLLCFISHGVCIQIQISKGKVEGEEVEVNGDVVNVFKSIPYAEPPIDDLRFRRPFEVGDWDGVFDSNEYMSPCPNGFNPESAKNTSEDCLYLSVFADQKCLNTSCPVVFFVHDLIGQPMSSGDFSELEVAHKFAYDGIVFVRPNYRMGLLGFLDLGEDLDEAPYNVGLHDLRLALQFVNREIRAFGGDPNRITIFGSSYGADLSVLLLNSPKFREIPISQGILFSAMPSIGGGHSLNATKKVLELLKCDFDSDQVPLTSAGSLACLNNKSSEEIDAAVFKAKTPETYWGPRFDQDLLPANDQPQLRELWRPLPLLLIINAPDSEDKNSKKPTEFEVEESCETALPVFGYYSNSSLQECIEYYTNNGKNSLTDAQYAFTVNLARMNTAKGGDSYIGVIGGKVELEDDVKFLMVNASEAENDEESQIVNRYNEKIRRFIKGLDGDWTTSGWHGAGYYLFDFPRPTENSTDFVGGVMINDSYFNEPAIKFWLNDLAIEEASESEEEETKIIPPPAENDDNDDQNEENNSETSESSANSVKATTKFGHIGAYSDTKTLAERELEVETVWMLFSIILVAAIALALLVIVLCLCLLKEKRGRRRVYRPSPVKFIQS